MSGRRATSGAGPGSTTQIEATLTAFGAAATRVRVTVSVQTFGRRAGRAIRVAGGLWGAALLAAFLPIVHFVLVPGLLGLGAALGALRLRQGTVIVSVVGPCPRCGRTADFPLGARRVASQRLTCPGGHNNLELALAGTSPAAPRVPPS